MYQVYHKDSTATSTIAWGYRAIKENPANYSYETGIIDLLSSKIEDARETEDRETRKKLYREAMPNRKFYNRPCSINTKVKAHSYDTCFYTCVYISSYYFCSLFKSFYSWGIDWI